MNEDEISEYFDYLEALRQSGETNMFGAGPYLMEEFGVSRKESHEILERWMGSYDKKEEEK
jgi:hypothetical protein